MNTITIQQRRPLLRRSVLAVALILGVSTSHTAGPGPLIAMVLPRDSETMEAAFRDYLDRRGVGARYELLRWSAQAQDQPALVARLRQLAPDLVYTSGLDTTLAVAGPIDGSAKAYLRERPVVFTEVDDPIGGRLVANLAAPGRKLSGVRQLPPLAAKLDALLSYRPFKRIGVLINPADRDARGARTALTAAAGERGLQLLEATLPLDSSGQPTLAALPALVQELKTRGAEVLFLGASSWSTTALLQPTVQAAHAARLPSYCSTEAAVRQAGCLFALVSTDISSGRFAGYKAAQVLLEKRHIDELPIESLKRFSLLVNMPAAKALGLYPPLLVLEGAELVQAGR
jgi:putative tryptophan/tyrosine transport system substrate-binding protein